MMTDFDPNKYLTTRVHGGVREIVGEEAKKIRERVRNRMMNGIVERLRSEVKIMTNPSSEIMQDWDSWRHAIAKGDTSSWPRDAFESYLDYYSEMISNAADEIERLQKELILVKAERDGLASVLEDVRAECVEQRRIAEGLTQAILDHIDASLEYERDYK